MKTLLVIALLAGGVATATYAEENVPTPHWATKGGVVDLGANGPAWENTDLADILRIEDTYKRWGMYYDEARMDLLPSVFTEDGELQLYVGSGEMAGSFSGPEAIGDFLSKTIEAQGDQRRHLMTNVLVESISGTEASTVAYGAVLVADSGMKLDISALYTGDLVKGSDGVWRFRRLAIAMDSYAGGTK